MFPSTSDYLFRHQMNVRIDDINFGNHLCHSKFINIIHHARALFLKNYGLSEINCFNHGLVMLNLNIDYISQCFFNDLLEIAINFDKLEKSKFSLKYLVFNHTCNKIAAHATTLMGFLDIKNQKLTRVPVEFLKLFEVNLNCVSNNHATECLV